MDEFQTNLLRMLAVQLHSMFAATLAIQLHGMPYSGLNDAQKQEVEKMAAGMYADYGHQLDAERVKQMLTIQPGGTVVH